MLKRIIPLAMVMAIGLAAPCSAAQDEVREVARVRALAEQGNAAAQTVLGAMYDAGIKGIPKDDATAAN